MTTPQGPEPPAAEPPAAEPLVVGAWSMLGSPLAAAVLAGTGADWLVLDGQHGLYDDATTTTTLAVLAGAAPGPGVGSTERPRQVLVRVPSADPAAIGRALDGGATGVLVPMVQDEHDAAAAARACRYPPDGTRSWGSWAGAYGGATVAADEANRGVFCAVMVETPTALDRVDAVAATPGVDLVFVGPYDLSLALGTTHAGLLADRSPDGPLPRVVAACRRAGVPAGAFASTLDDARALAAHGFTWLAVLVDTVFLADAGAALVADARRIG